MKMIYIDEYLESHEALMKQLKLNKFNEEHWQKMHHEMLNELLKNNITYFNGLIKEAIYHINYWLSCKRALHEDFPDNVMEIPKPKSKYMFEDIGHFMEGLFVFF